MVFIREENQQKILYPDSLIGTDSHTTMINALGVLGWGVGGIEAEAVMLGESVGMILPEVIGVKSNQYHSVQNHTTSIKHLPR